MAHNKRESFLKRLFSRTGVALIGFLGVAGFLLWDEHEAHILGYLPLILILGLCLGMHFLMHGGKASEHTSHHDDPGRDDT